MGRRQAFFDPELNAAARRGRIRGLVIDRYCVGHGRHRGRGRVVRLGRGRKDDETALISFLQDTVGSRATSRAGANVRVEWRDPPEAYRPSSSAWQGPRTRPRGPSAPRVPCITTWPPREFAVVHVGVTAAALSVFLPHDKHYQHRAQGEARREELIGARRAAMPNDLPAEQRKLHCESPPLTRCISTTAARPLFPSLGFCPRPPHWIDSAKR